MITYADLTQRGRLRRLRRLAERALTLYEIEPVSLHVLGYFYNTTFAVTAVDGSRYVLRVQRATDGPMEDHPVPPAERRARVESEMWWLDRLRADLDIPVPAPVRARSGEEAVEMAVDGVPEPRLCVLFRWMNGRFLHHRLMPAHLEAVGRLTARLHEHSTRLDVPAGFSRPPVDTTDLELEASVVRNFTDNWSPESADVMREALQRMRRVQEELGKTRDTFGLIHADIHQENYLFHDGEIRLIDFDDCGWGHYLYDLGVTVHETEYLPRGPGLRAALLRGYRQVRHLSPDHEAMIDTFSALRELQITNWFLKERDNPALNNPRAHVGWGVAAIQRFLA